MSALCRSDGWFGMSLVWFGIVIQIHRMLDVKSGKWAVSVALQVRGDPGFVMDLRKFVADMGFQTMTFRS